MGGVYESAWFAFGNLLVPDDGRKVEKDTTFLARNKSSP